MPSTSHPAPTITDVQQRRRVGTGKNQFGPNKPAHPAAGTCKGRKALPELTEEQKTAVRDATAQRTALHRARKRAANGQSIQYDRTYKGAAPALADYSEPSLPPIPAPLTAAISAAAGDAHAVLSNPSAADFIFHAVAASSDFASIEVALALPGGTLNGWCLSSPELITRTALALGEAAERLDRQARSVMRSPDAAPNQMLSRMTLAFVNCLRSGAESKRRIAESIMRRVTALEDHREQKAREAAARREAEAAATSRAEARQRRRDWEAKMIAACGHPPPAPVQAVQPNGTPITEDEFRCMSPWEQMEAQHILEDDRDPVAAQTFVDAIRDRWRRQHLELMSTSAANPKPTTPSTVKGPF